MASARTPESRKPANRLYRGGKVSEYRFRRVLRAYAADTPQSTLARQMRLSLNSIAAMYQRFRAHYVRIGVFRDFYRDDYPDGAPDSGRVDEFEAYEHAQLEFHLARVSRMRGVKIKPGAVDYHFCESCWRFGFAPFFENRPAEPVHEMMFNELLTYLKVGGPVGTKSPDLRAIRAFQIETLDRKADWLRRNSRELRSPNLRSTLQEIIKF